MAVLQMVGTLCQPPLLQSLGPAGKRGQVSWFVVQRTRAPGLLNFIFAEIERSNSEEKVQ